MLTHTIIGHLGADAEYKNENGKEFIVFRIANTDKWTDDAGTRHEQTTWVDCIMSGKPKVLEFLKKGQQVYAHGTGTLRVYSSAKDKCMKAGLTINVRQIELLGGRPDDVPQVLYTEDGQTEIRVGKYFYAPGAASEDGSDSGRILVSRNGERFVADKDGWVKREEAQAS